MKNFIYKGQDNEVKKYFKPSIIIIAVKDALVASFKIYNDTRTLVPDEWLGL